MAIHSACNKVWVMTGTDSRGLVVLRNLQQDTVKSSDTSRPNPNAVISSMLSHRQELVHNPLLFLEVIGLADLPDA